MTAREEQPEVEAAAAAAPLGTISGTPEAESEARLAPTTPAKPQTYSDDMPVRPCKEVSMHVIFVSGHHDARRVDPEVDPLIWKVMQS